MNKNLVIALLVLAGGVTYYFFGRSAPAAPSAKAGYMSPDGVYTDKVNGFSITFPAGWKEVPASQISPANGYKFSLPKQAGSALVVIPPGPGKAAAMLIKTSSPAQELKALALKFLSRSSSMQRQDLGSDAAAPAYQETPASPGEPHRITGSAVLDDQTLSHYCFFAGAQNVFILYSLAETGFSPGLPAELDAMAASIKLL